MEDRERLVRVLIERSLDEDAAREDETTALLVDGRLRARASIIAKAAGIVSGHRIAAAVFRSLDAEMRYDVLAGDGSAVGAGEAICALEGSCAAILAAERTALNFLQHLSGVATLTGRFVERIAGSGVVILDTRKTTPGLRALEKEAVRHGGGKNHRFDLRERLLVKENHIAAAGGIPSVLERLGARRLRAAEIEVASFDELRQLRRSPPGRIMLDNFTPDMVREAVAEVDLWGDPRPEVEVSGGISLETAALYAVTGVDYLSIGSLTSSAPALDLSLTLSEVE